MKMNFSKLVATATLAFMGVLTPLIAQEVEMTPTEKNTQRISTLESQVEKLNNLKISGYIQAQWKWNQAGGAADPVLRDKFEVRRGRIKTMYTQGIATYCLQFDATESGIGIKDAYALFSNPTKTISFQAGSMERPFGYEIGVSSATLESPERSMVVNYLFPGEYDLGSQIILTGKDGLLKMFTLNAGLYNGNGIGTDTDSKKDFIGKLAFLKKTENAQIGAALSYYNGGIMGKDSVYNFTSDKGYVKSASPKFSYEKREYFGIGAQYLNNWSFGTTSIRGEFMTGTQPGTSSTSKNPGKGASLGDGKTKLYVREFRGGYIMLCQNIGATKHTVTLKYDFYDPNTKVSGDEIGKAITGAGTSKADIAISTIGLGYIYRLNANVKLMAYYDMVTNETSQNLTGYKEKINQDMFTARLQVKF